MHATQLHAHTQCHGPVVCMLVNVRAVGFCIFWCCLHADEHIVFFLLLNDNHGHAPTATVICNRIFCAHRLCLFGKDMVECVCMCCVCMHSVGQIIQCDVTASVCQSQRMWLAQCFVRIDGIGWRHVCRVSVT